MAATDDTSKKRPSRKLTPSHVSAETSPRTPITSLLEQLISRERRRLLQVHSVLHCLYEVLLYAEGEETATYAEAAHLAAMLVDDVVANLDSSKLRPMIEAVERGARVAERYTPPDDNAVREPGPASPYFH